MSKKSLGIDFGTSTIKMFRNREGLILDEKNIIAIYKKTIVLAAGNEAFEMYEKAPDDIRVLYPIHNGVIADINYMQMLLKYFIDKLGQQKLKGAEYYLAVPTDITEVETRAYYSLISDSKLKAKKIYLIEKPVANAMGLGIDISKEKGILLLDIGANTTEISILSLGGLVVSKLLAIGGERFDEVITQIVKKKENYIIGARTAEFVKKELVSAVPVRKTVNVYGRSLVTGLPGKITVESNDIFNPLKDFFIKITDAIKILLERTPPEIMEGLRNRGIYLTGGSSKIQGLDQLVHEEIGLPVKISMNPENTVILGLGAIMENPKEFKGDLLWEERRR